MSHSQKKPTTVLFLCWGYTIHAYRSIKIFCDDPRFRVVVVSPYNYHFDNAINIVLNGEGKYVASGWLFNITNFVRLIISAIVAYITLIWTYKKYRPQAIFLHTLMYPCYLAYGLPKRTPIIVTFWNGDLIWWAKWNGIERLLKKRIVQYGARRAAAITLNSLAAMEVCSSTYGVKRETIHLIRYPGVDLGFFKPMSKEVAREKLGIKHKQVLLWPRGLGSYLNSDVLLQAAPIILKKFPDTLFVVVSKVGADLVEEYKRGLAHLNILENFQFRLQIEHSEMPFYYGAADGMISLSSNDSLPNVMLESFACERPVIMGDIPCLHEWIKNGYNGILAPNRDHRAVADACIALLDDKNSKVNELYAKRGRNKVFSEANSDKSIPAIKELVLSISGNVAISLVVNDNNVKGSDATRSSKTS